MLDIDHDLHVHTYLSACCHDEDQRCASILPKAAAAGLKTVGFADHVWTNPDEEPSDWYRPQDASQIARLREELAGVDTDVRVLVGCEGETVAPGRFGITPEIVEQVDFVLLPCNHLHMTGFVQQPESEEPRAMAEHVLAMFRSAAASGMATAIPHPLKPLGREPEMFDAVIAAMSDAELLDAFGIAAEHNVAMEITRGFVPPEDGPTWSIETPLRFLSLARQAGCKFIFASDAHALEIVGAVADIRPIVDALGLTAEDVADIAKD
jgi:histidinol phosphatase-like PHP family hydrolase